MDTPLPTRPDTSAGKLLRKLDTVKSQLDSVSPSFCLAKWNQVTIHLASGTTHSCHHCIPHKIPLSEIKDNPSALHNTQEKKEKRKQMLTGERPKECDFCWRVEDLKNPDVFSDRVKKSASLWNDSTIETIPQMPWDANVIPKYIEIDFSSACNFKCLYCSPAYSTTWAKEIREHGPIYSGIFTINSIKSISSVGGMPLEVDEDDNPYVQAFWKWFPEVVASNQLREMRITGGEPLLSKNTFKLIDYFVEHPQPNMVFSINSNLGAPKMYIDKLIKGMNKLAEVKAAKRLTVYTSGEGHGERGEYIRYGLNYKQWLENVDRILNECPDVEVTFMCAYNILSVSSFKPFLEDAFALIQKYTTPVTRNQPLVVSIPYVRHPEHLSAWVLDSTYLKYMEECVEYMKERPIKSTPDLLAKDGYRVIESGFTESSIAEMIRIYEVMKNAIVNNVGRNHNIIDLRRGFYQFIDQCDARRGTSFLTTFPEMTEFYNNCKTNYP